MKKRCRQDQEPSIRRPPGFMEYGADLAALEAVKLMSLAERGLFATMRWAIWSNDTIPRDAKSLARVLGLAEDDVVGNLSDRVMSFFVPDNDRPDRLVCPELAAQMRRLMERREKMVVGAKNSHKARQNHTKAPDGTHAATHLGTHAGLRVASELNRTALNRTALTKTEDQILASGHKSWVDGYEKEERGG